MFKKTIKFLNEKINYLNFLLSVGLIFGINNNALAQGAEQEVLSGLQSVQETLNVWATPVATIFLMIGGAYFWWGDRNAKDRVFQILIGVAIVGYAYDIVTAILGT